MSEDFDLKGALDNLENLPTTIEWIKLLKHKHNNFYELFFEDAIQASKILGMTQQAISGLTLGKSVMSDETAVKIARELNIPPLLVVMAAIRERTKSQEIIDILDTVPKEFFKAGCYILLGFGLSVMPVSTYFS